MRTTQNPLRGSRANVANPKAVVCSIVHLPDLTSEYHRQRFDVVKLSLTSMAKYCGSAEVMVWDNGSCPEFVDWLQKVYRPDYYMQSKNIGKQSARANVMHMFPPKTIIGISDDDMLFYPGWFDASVDLLKNFPNVGVVSAYPVRTQFRWGCQNTIRWAWKHARVEYGRFIPAEWDRDFCTSIGRDYQSHVEMCDKMGDQEVRIAFDGRSAYATGHHCQFIAYNDRLAKFCQWNETAMGEEKSFDISIDNAGLLRLTTIDRYARHIGNVLDDGIIADAVKLGIMQEA